MRRFLIIALSLIMLSCVSTDGRPSWVDDIPSKWGRVCGVGEARLSTSHNSRMASEAAARADLARRLEVSIDEAVATYVNDSHSRILNAYEEITIQTVDLSIRNIRLDERWTDEDGTVWTLVSIPSSDVDDIFVMAANDYRSKLEERRLDIEARYMALLEELSSSASADAEAIAKAALDYISDEVSTIDEILSGISDEDIEAVRGLLMAE